MRRWATALRQVAYDSPDTGQGTASSATPMGLHLDYSEEFRSRRTGDIPPALTSSLSFSFPFLEKPRPEEPPSPPEPQQPEETDSPRSPPPEEESKANVKPHRQKMLVRFPFRKRKVTPRRRLLTRNPQVASASLLIRRTRVLSRYPTTGQIPRVLVPPLGAGSLPLAGNGSMRAVQPMSHLRRVRQTGRRLHPHRSKTRVWRRRRPFS